jgi:hypothetical protein
MLSLTSWHGAIVLSQNALVSRRGVLFFVADAAKVITITAGSRAEINPLFSRLVESRTERAYDRPHGIAAAGLANPPGPLLDSRQWAGKYR